MTNPKGRFHNVETGEVIDRELTDAELAQLANTQAMKMPSENGN
jgi:hypothetical protein